MNNNWNIIKQKASKILMDRTKNGNIPDLFGIEDGEYYELVWDYPGKYYKQHLSMKTEEEFISYIVKETLRNRKK